MNDKRRQDENRPDPTCSKDHQKTNDQRSDAKIRPYDKDKDNKDNTKTTKTTKTKDKDKAKQAKKRQDKPRQDKTRKLPSIIFCMRSRSISIVSTWQDKTKQDINQLKAKAKIETRDKEKEKDKAKAKTKIKDKGIRAWLSTFNDLHDVRDTETFVTDLLSFLTLPPSPSPSRSTPPSPPSSSSPTPSP